MAGWQALAVLLVAWLPGAFIFRLPIAGRPRRAALPAEERAYWSVILSVALSSVVVLSLAAAGWYRFDRLLWTNGGLSLAIALVARGRLLYGRTAPLPTWTAAVPAALVVLAWSMTFAVPPSEYVMGGKDPGVYMNEGIQIAQGGHLVVADTTVAAVPAGLRDLFFPDRGQPTYYSNRFMGFFLMDPSSGTVISQFTHLYPAWIAIAYGVGGLTGARVVLGLWAMLGVVSVYFLGNRLFGRAAGAAGAALLTVHVLQVWYSRYPNAEIVMQPLAFAGLLAYVRAQTDDDRFFAPIAGVLFTLCVFAHLTGAFVMAGVAAAVVVGRFANVRLRGWFAVPFVAGGVIAAAYLTTFLAPYFAVPVTFVRQLSFVQELGLAAACAAAVLLWWGAARDGIRRAVQTALPPAFVIVLWLLAAYAWFFRAWGGGLAPHDADALRTFASFYATPLGLAAALVGLAVAARRSFWTSAPLLIVFATFSVFFFYKIRIVPEHFWVGRRFIAVILPGTLLLAAAAALSTATPGNRWSVLMGGRAYRTARAGIGLLLVLALGYQYVSATRPILRHVEYAGLIPRLEKLASIFGDDDLVIVEGRAASDAHVLALPLAYIYARQVLVLWGAAPDKSVFREFLGWARGRYRRIFFLGGGGTELLSRTMSVRAIGGERFQIPEYESRWNTYPRATRFKEFDFAVYEFLPRQAPAAGFDLDVGVADDLYVRRFNAKERRPSGATFRWARAESFVSIVGTRADCRRLTIWMGSGGRPAAAEPADVELFLDDVSIGAVTAGDGFSAFSFDIPPDLAARIAGADDAAQLRIVSRTWNPRRLVGANDSRDLGVMVDRVAVECPAVAAP